MGSNEILRHTARVNLLEAKITSGPARERLFDLLRLHSLFRQAGQILENIDVLTADGKSLTLQAIVQEIGNEGAEHDWFLTLTFNEVPNQLEFVPRLPSYRAYYNTRTRRGAILTGDSVRQMITVNNDGDVMYGGYVLGRVVW